MSEGLSTEQELFNELEMLCKSPGYFHVIAYFCFRDNTIKYVEGEMGVDDVMQQFSMERLVRTEISTLIGLACKGDLDMTHPGPQKIQEYIDLTQSLLHDLHKSMMPPMHEIFHRPETGEATYNPFSRGKLLRESIFYGGESAYNFQYRDLSIRKYQNDNIWFVENKGYSIE